MVYKTTYSQHWLLDHHTIYLATWSPKQSISGLATGSCAGTPSVTLSSSHCSKFRTSKTQNVRSSVSTAQMPWVIERFLQTTTARLPQPWASIRWTTALDLLRKLLLPTGTGKVITPPTSLTTTLSYRVLVRMIGLGESLGWNTMLTSTYSEGDEARDSQNMDRDWGHVLQWRKVIKLEIFIRLGQESFDTSLNLCSLKSHIVLWIRTIRWKRMW